MYVCVCVYIDILNTYTRTHHVLTYLYVYIHICLYMCIYMYAFMSIYIYICIVRKRVSLIYRHSVT